MSASPFMPPRSLRNAHLQSVMSSGPARARQAARALADTGACHQSVLLDAGEGVRLQGIFSHAPDAAATPVVALLLHGWEGSAESNYVRAAAAHLLADGLAVFRLNFRDHGETHHLNEAIFHSGRIDEVVAAAQALVARSGVRRLLVGGWSLGGNFALRLALRARQAGLPLAGVAAVCPAIDPARTMDAMEAGMPLYLRYFEHKWRRSLARKRELFPQAHDFDDRVLKLRMRPLTAYFAERHTDYGSLEGYFDAYSVAGERLAALPMPVDILMAADDPVVPAEDFHAIARLPMVRVELASHGGHCGFLRDWRMHGYGEAWMAARFRAALDGG
ncbi:alpha/beta fold hydrolase [Lysobacter pythonis]|uniref:Alpha/beta fold hydrolase n=1 Tax=Solilutibacter pythonis TaxID=2483112 RepID=A0A3M2HXR1_9GAMM|nr:alpha/beta fold hydrolase [Lysobacter pythonis]RMH90967.1 alpha/beta fold hydrolase [Lysobacter pythonis]